MQKMNTERAGLAFVPVEHNLPQRLPRCLRDASTLLLLASLPLSVHRSHLSPPFSPSVSFLSLFLSRSWGGGAVILPVPAPVVASPAEAAAAAAAMVVAAGPKQPDLTATLPQAIEPVVVNFDEG